MLYKRYKIKFDNPQSLPNTLEDLLTDSYDGIQLYNHVDHDNHIDMIIPWDADIVINDNMVKLVGSAGPSGFGKCVVTLTPEEFDFNIDAYVFINEDIEVTYKFKDYGWILNYTGTKMNYEDQYIIEEDLS